MVIYQTKSGALGLRGDFRAETIWATQAQIAQAFDVDARTINEHIGNVYKTGELDKKPTIRNFRIVQKEGKRSVEREVIHYNLDVVLSVGYRVSSKNATCFRKWTTETLRKHIVDGYTINRARIGKNYQAFMEAVANVRALLPAGNTIETKDILELISVFADTWFSLNAFDKGEFTTGKPTKKKVVLTAEKLNENISIFKRELIDRGEASTFSLPSVPVACLRVLSAMSCRPSAEKTFIQASKKKPRTSSTLSWRTTYSSRAYGYHPADRRK